MVGHRAGFSLRPKWSIAALAKCTVNCLWEYGYSFVRDLKGVSGCTLFWLGIFLQPCNHFLMRSILESKYELA